MTIHILGLITHRPQSLLLASLAAMALARPALAEGTAPGNQDYFINYTLVQVDQCMQVDDLLRSTCARIGSHLSAENAKYCSLPAARFSDRVASPLRSFRESHRADIQRNAQSIADLTAQTRRDLDRQFADVRAGKVSMFDLRSLSQILQNDCANLERDHWLWLTKSPTR